MAIRSSKPGDFTGVGPTYHGQIDCSAVVFVGVHAAACGNDFDVNIGIATNPAVQSPIDLPHNSVAAPSLLHGVVHDFVVVGVVIEHDGDHAAFCQHSVAIASDDCHRAVCVRRQRGGGWTQKLLIFPSTPCGAHTNPSGIPRFIK